VPIEEEEEEGEAFRYLLLARY